MTKSLPIGIDLGTTYSCVGVWKDNNVDIIDNDLGYRTTPSYVAFDDYERLIGNTALHKMGMNPENTIFGIKRLMGRDFYDTKVQSNIKYLPYKVIEKYGKPYVSVKYKNENKNFTPEEISAMILSKMKKIAEDRLGQPVTDAVITVPAYFNDSQRRATIDAGKIAGLNVLRIINEPTAAALAYGLNKKNKNRENILIVDLGGGTYDVSLLTIKNDTFKVRAIAGDTNLGGEDFDNRLIDYFVEEFKRMYNIDLSTNPKSMSRLRTNCERAKRILSSSYSTTIDIECLYKGIDFKSQITRSRFEELCSDIFEKIIEPIENVLEDSNLSKSDIHDVVLVGGSTRIPKIQEIIKTFFNGKELKKTINPDEAVACGAAIQASILSDEVSEEIKNMTLLDVIPLSLGTDIKGGIMSTIIKRNSTIPMRKTKSYYTTSDNQTSVLIQVCEGERALIKDNNLLDEFTLHGITKAPRGEAKIDVTFDIDKNGILNVLAEEKGTGIYKKIIVDKNKGKLYKDEIDRMIKESEKFRENDEEVKKRIRSLNNLENYAYDLRKSLKSKNMFFMSYDMNNLQKTINSTLKWINDNQNASIEEYENMKLKLEKIANPIFNPLIIS